ncbi:hypothetical protein JQ615_40350 [Bradyrhizobium jicamae]|uniref:DUF6894 domain-containing protein n=1 Tax=Bradyrhizobium jicamae TaxID=280332 RepID=A0ABS5FXP8_9BRAD|nr:hypothetical protein [Bradyrhizobium jicamae]MBR0801604.1 hypothetical protein [Bradyrhizobium jicamae]MBR0937312.1 hypothetical protein [Bradyrhizobium jicamae]
MPRYFFDIRDITGLYPDEEGMEFVDQRGAEIEASRTLADIAKNVASSDDRTDLVIEVRTDGGPIFKAALIFETKSPKQ